MPSSLKPQRAIELSCLCAFFILADAATVQAEPKPVKDDEDFLLIAPVEGDSVIEKRIREARELLDHTDTRARGLEILGWAYIDKARKDGDPGFFLHAQACARSLEGLGADTRQGALLLQGHLSHQLHAFERAESIARQLVQSRGASLDYALLGDALFDQGDIAGATRAYQKMMDLRPGLAASLRAAEIRWIRGDVSGCLDMIPIALRAGSRRQPESLAWAYSRSSYFLMAAGRLPEAGAAAERSLDVLPDYLPGIVAKGRAALAKGDLDGATAVLTSAVERVPQPAAQWLLWECLNAAGRAKEAEIIQAALLSSGKREDPRTLALYLATIDRDLGLAVALCRKELTERRDIYTQDAMAWALCRQAGADPEGNASILEEARTFMTAALKPDTQDARLFLHAGLLWTQSQERTLAQTFLNRSKALEHMLLPTEKALLQEALASSEGGDASHD